MIPQASYSNDYQNKGHECRNLVIRCMDFRFWPSLDRLLNMLFEDEGGFGDYDSPGVGGGGSKSIIDEESRKVVFSALDIAIGKHHVNRAVIIDHIDCGAYGGSSKFTNANEEEEFHKNQLIKAGGIIKDKYPELKVILLYQNWESLKQVENS